MTNEPPQLRGERAALVLTDGARRPPRARLHPVLGGRRSLSEGVHHPHVNRQRRRERGRADGQPVDYWKVRQPEETAVTPFVAEPKRPKPCEWRLCRRFALAALSAQWCRCRTYVLCGGLLGESVRGSRARRLCFDAQPGAVPR